jgi:hypothetical protein
MPIQLPPRTKDISGLKFGRLTAIEPIERKRNGHIVYACDCECGGKASVTNSNLKAGHTLSCGCFRLQRIYESNRKHGRSGTPLYRVWSQMHDRCYLRSAPNYLWYGGRGIRVVDRWHEFENFLADMGERPKGMSIDRIDSNGDYGPENCRWATKAEQSRNTRRNRFVTHEGRTQTVTDWERELGVNSDTIGKRLRKGWSVERAIAPSRRTLA